MERYRDQHAEMTYAGRLLLRAMRISGKHGDDIRELMERSFYPTHDPHKKYQEEPWEQRARMAAEMAIRRCDEESSYPVRVAFKSYDMNVAIARG